MRVGFWLDWNSPIEDEIETWSQMLELFVFDRVIDVARIKDHHDIAAFDGDMFVVRWPGAGGGRWESGHNNASI